MEWIERHGGVAIAVNEDLLAGLRSATQLEGLVFGLAPHNHRRLPSLMKQGLIARANGSSLWPPGGLKICPMSILTNKALLQLNYGARIFTC